MKKLMNSGMLCREQKKYENSLKYLKESLVVI